MTTTPRPDRYDLIVVGLGPGGEEVGERMAEAGWSVLGIDRRLVGGECPYYGCIPSKMIIRGAAVLAESRRVNELPAGESVTTPEYAPVSRRIRDEATDDWDDQVAVDRFEGLGGTFVRGVGRLAGRAEDGHLQVDVDGRMYRAPRVVVSVGTAPAIPPIDGLAALRGEGGPNSPVWTNRDVMRATAAPTSLVVLGGGSIGVELAQAFGRFGTRVTVVESADRLVSVEEPRAAEVLAEVFRREGMDLRIGVSATRIAAGGDGVEVTLADGQMVTGEKLLVCVGRRSNLADVALDSVGLDPKARTIDVDDHMAVAGVEGLYGIGDITGRGAFTHVAVWQARVLVAHLLDRPSLFGGYHGLAWVSFTDPEIGRVGLSEAQARGQGLTVRTGSATIASSARGWIHGPGNDGFVYLVEDADQGVLVGATVMSPYGGEILGLLTAAVHARVPTSLLTTMHYAYPTLHRAILDAVNDLTS
jgi:pyruvate/2-oxoglutarate dehydrogenase complex dihydrolipoamide dehydrogenase (E3) component